jgi:hypothetical protein
LVTGNPLRLRSSATAMARRHCSRGASRRSRTAYCFGCSTLRRRTDDCAVEILHWARSSSLKTRECNRMPRPRKRVCLPERCKLDLNLLRKQGIIRPGATKGPWRVEWTNSRTGETIASGFISASMDSDHRQSWSNDHSLAEPRHFGGRQWYFSCPLTQRRVSVLWKPPGAHLFSSRHSWGREVGYAQRRPRIAERLKQQQRL